MFRQIFFVLAETLFFIVTIFRRLLPQLRELRSLLPYTAGVYLNFHFHDTSLSLSRQRRERLPGITSQPFSPPSRESEGYRRYRRQTGYRSRLASFSLLGRIAGLLGQLSFFYECPFFVAILVALTYIPLSSCTRERLSHRQCPPLPSPSPSRFRPTLIVHACRVPREGLKDLSRHRVTFGVVVQPGNLFPPRDLNPRAKGVP